MKKVEEVKIHRATCEAHLIITVPTKVEIDKMNKIILDTEIRINELGGFKYKGRRVVGVRLHVNSIKSTM